MTNDTMKAIINDTRDLAATCKNPMTRLALEGIANRLQALCDAGLYITPKAAIDAVTANPPIDVSRGDAKTRSGKEPAGHVHTDGHVLAWSYQDGHAVRVTCDWENGTDGIWHLTARVGNRPVVSGQVYGGKTVAREVTIYLRNGLTRYTMHNRMKRLARNLAKKAAAKGEISAQ